MNYGASVTASAAGFYHTVLLPPVYRMLWNPGKQFPDVRQLACTEGGMIPYRTRQRACKGGDNKRVLQNLIASRWVVVLPSATHML